MAWTNSKVFRSFVADLLGNTMAFDADTDTLKVALYDNDITPAQDVTSANAAYGAGVWTSVGSQDGTTGDQIYHTGQWAQGGVALTSVTVDSATAATVFLDAADTASGSAATMSNIYGGLVYSDTLATPVADQACSFNYFGGANSVTNGTFTVVWNANGIFRFTL